ncbi:MAG: aminopeptidase N [Gammaproteobacteria bacterium]|nr:MAG: aminopeptidase N [Gammaproteobacteria bacterium]
MTNSAGAGKKPAIDKKTKYLSDYKSSDFSIEKVYLDFSLFDNHVIVTAKAHYVKDNKRVKNLQLAGEELELLSLSLDGQRHDNYELNSDGLVVKQVPARFVLSTQVKIHPEKNSLLEGLYRSGDIFCTQCEAEGFRHITYFLDRPDVMTQYFVRIEADKSKYPTLLSNGNLIEQGNAANGRHFAKWHDPFAKPSYLFALVAGDLAVVEKTVKTASNREVLLQVFTEKAFIHQADYALGALQRAMRWDEETFNLEYDLDRYMIVAIGAFNMGAMENKGLNIFNAKYILATPETATDKDFHHIENVIGHEYFHNWTGNRVTCRDWFQLSLKEGLTVFRDSLFSADMTTKGIKRLEEVRTVREHQFIEDQGPMSHPVRPDNYIEINNFYTLTIYEKGAEIIRMMYNLIGEDNFKKGIALYLKRHDGQAVTVEDFAQAMSDASGTDLTGQFFRWYTQSGTPELQVSSEYDAPARLFRIHLSQHHAPTAGQPDKDNLVIPVAYRLYNEEGKAISSEHVVVLDSGEKTLEFGSIRSRPVVSLLRNFSAPVTVSFEQKDDDLHTLLRHDDDLFVRFDAVQILLKRAVKLALDNQDDKPAISAIAASLNHVLCDTVTPAAEKAELLTLPGLSVFFDVVDPIDVDVLNKTVLDIKRRVISALQDNLRRQLEQPTQFAADDLTFAATSQRSLRNACLALLSQLKDDESMALAQKQFAKADNMTNQLAALAALNQVKGNWRDTALATFYQRFKDDPQVIDKWFAVQAMADFDDTIASIKALARHPAFSMTTPNRVRALFTTFSMRNLAQFHAVSGQGYDLIADVVAQLDDINPSIAARMVAPLTQWKRFDNRRANLMKDKLQQLLNKKSISKDLYEIVSKSI